MNQDIEFPTPKEIERIRNEILDADGIWIFTPEYNHFFPGVLKNLLDWVSRPLEAGNYEKGSAIKNKKVTISGVAGKSAASFAMASLRELLGFMNVQLLEKQTGVSANEAFQTGILQLTNADKVKLEEQANAFIAFLNE